MAKSKLTEEQVARIKEMYLAGALQVEIAKELDVSQPTIHYQLKKMGLTKSRKVLEDSPQDVTGLIS